MKQSRSKLARLIAERTLQSGVSKQLSQEVAAYLLTERRVNELDSVLRDVQADWAEAGQVEVIARSAHALTPRAKSDIAKRLKPFYPAAKQIIVTEVRDPEVIGGVRLNLADSQLDLSIRTKLDNFKQAAMAGKE
jgi:F-type H+-transporting ATPase subunit delta